MELTDIRALFEKQEEFVGKKVTVGGWIRNSRDSKVVGFIVLNDGTYFKPLQVVYTDALPNFADISKLNVVPATYFKGILEKDFKYLPICFILSNGLNNYLWLLQAARTALIPSLQAFY